MRARKGKEGRNHEARNRGCKKATEGREREKKKTMREKGREIERGTGR